MKKKSDQVFRAIADPTRREIFHLLALGSALSISQLAGHFEISRQGISKHIKVLEEADLVRLNKNGREQICFAEAKSLQVVKDWLQHYDSFWESKLQNLSDHLDGKA